MCNQDLIDKNIKYLLYGNGALGKLLLPILGASFVGFIDKNTEKISQDFDYIIVTVLGEKEESIADYLNLKFNLSKDQII